MEERISADVDFLKEVGFSDAVAERYATWMRTFTPNEYERSEPIHCCAVQRLQGHLDHLKEDTDDAHLALFSVAAKRGILDAWSRSSDSLANVALEWLYHRCYPLSPDTEAVFRGVQIGSWSNQLLVDTDEQQPFSCYGIACADAWDGAPSLRLALDTHVRQGAEPFVYHATSWKHAENIIRCGLRPNFGQPRQDFSHHDGVYFSYDQDVALDWCRQNYGTWNNTAAILVYAKVAAFPAHKYCDLRDASALAVWRSVVKDYRTESKEPAVCRKMRVIEGPCANNVKRLSLLRPQDWVPTHDRPPIIQLCIKHAAVAAACLALRAVIVVVDGHDELDSTPTAASSASNLRANSSLSYKAVLKATTQHYQ